LDIIAPFLLYSLRDWLICVECINGSTRQTGVFIY